jgi:hypothetical protein
MTNATKLIAGLLLITVPTIEFGGTFLLRILSGKHSEFTEFQRSMFRAGHAHAGVLVILALVALIFTGQAGLSAPIGWAVRIGFAAAPALVSAGFFGAAIGESRTRLGGLIALLWIGVFVLAASVITLGIGLIGSRG